MNTISDELLSKFLDGKTTDEENEAIFAYCNAHEETLEELLIMRQAASMADKESDFVVEEDEKRHFVEQTIRSHSIKKRVKFTVWISVAAAMAVIIIVGTFFFRSRQNPDLIAQKGQNNKMTVSDSVFENDLLIEEDTTIAEPLNRNKTEQIKEQPQYSENRSLSAEKEPLKVQIMEKTTAATQTAENTFSMLKPDKSPYRILCKNLDKSFSFQWQATHAKKTEFILMNDKQVVLYEKTEAYFSSYSLSFRNVMEYNTLYWKVKIVFEDNTSAQKSGRIDVKYEL